MLLLMPYDKGSEIMNKKELAKKISKTTDSEETEVIAILDAALEEIGNIIKGGDKIKLHGFGAFYTRKYGERKCYNPVTGTIEKIPASVQPVFKAGPKLREKINK